MNPIIAYLERSLQEDAIYQGKDIHHREGYLLRLITLAHLTHKKVRSSEFIKDERLGSAPTISVAIRKLVEKGLIKRETDPVDQRNQWLIPTEHALELFRALSEVAGNRSKVDGG